ncbi:hypothetical protein PB2503_06162 [Parvularcula bermudensis HTCC2503]|uniref:Uncharacterized protein n=1 Tax=Parvularcula bermudensis (strain ATCC BAA-594 / HTCC2503 / KCTC 12087) TaxID=314260 RepID=E0THK2_PARBH|nr:hypothetical protein PB2503_06162 [Parvularcula bermudensis HTCC2503]
MPGGGEQQLAQVAASLGFERHEIDGAFVALHHLVTYGFF